MYTETGNGFMWNPHLGFIQTCPSNIGTAMRASVHIKLPHLCKYEGFDNFLRHGMKLDKRGAGKTNQYTPAKLFILRLHVLKGHRHIKTQLYVCGRSNGKYSSRYLYV